MFTKEKKETSQNISDDGYELKDGNSSRNKS